MLHNVVALALPGVGAFELGVFCEVFGVDRSDHGIPRFDFAVVSPNAEPVRSSAGFSISPDHGLDRGYKADLVCVPASEGDSDLSPAVVDLLRSTVERGGRVMSACTGAFTLAAAGLLDGRQCTTHWMAADDLASEYPLARVQCDVLYVDDDPIFTSAGTAASIDSCLHLVRKELGASVANGIARRMVVPPHREGGQAQYIDVPVPETECETLQPLLGWLLENLDEDHTVDELATRTHLSSRTFARRFRSETGTTPHLWLTQQRLLSAERLLEQTDEPIERVATLSGFSSSSLLRHHFVRRRGTTPQLYRRAFRQSA
ncbi:MAG TPA: helix-turn-helix domain-containing protein [Actinomycetes bacterium]|nr:helix-turn-helix domain-containing protein [Actinomycetes bacterium]